jgi:hypothetical protein
MANKGLEEFRQIAEDIFREESKYRPGLRRGGAFKAECLAVIEGAARLTAAPYRGRRTGLVKGARMPVRAIAALGALSEFRKYLSARNIPRREFGRSGEVSEEGNSVTASTNVTQNGADRFNTEESKIFQRKTGRGRPPGFGEGSSTPDPVKIWSDAPWSGQFIAKVCKLTRGEGWNVVAPAGPWGKQRDVIRAWRRLRGDLQGPISLIDPNAAELFRVRGTALTYTPTWCFGLLRERSLVDTVAAA